MLSGIIQDLVRRRVPHFLAIYLAACWGVIEAVDWLVDRYALSPHLVDIALVALLSMLPTVLLLAYFHGGPGAQGWTAVERIGVPTNLLAAAAVVVFMFSGKDLSARGPFTELPDYGTLDPQRVAVLPFRDLSEAEEFGPLALGLTDQLIHALTQSDALAVVSFTTAAAYQDAKDELVHDLHVGTLVEGTIVGSGEGIRLIVQLTDAATSDVIASTVLERSVEEPLPFIDGLADVTSRLLRQRLGAAIRLRRLKAGTESTEAWELVQRAEALRSFANDLVAAGEAESAARDFERADSLLNLAESMDREWVEPILRRGWLAKERARLAARGVRLYDRELLGLGISHADRALDLEPKSAEALELRGTLLVYLWEMPGAAEDTLLRARAERDLRGATVTDPRLASAWNTLSRFYRLTGNHERAWQAAQRALDVDVFLAHEQGVVFRLCHLSLELRYWDELERWCQEGRRRWPTSASFINAELVALAGPEGPEPDVDRAWELLDSFLESSPPHRRAERRPPCLLIVAAVLARAGLSDSARVVIRQARESETTNDPYMDYYEANVRLQLGERDDAVNLLARYLDARPAQRDYIAREWWWETLRDHPRFQALLEK